MTGCFSFMSSGHTQSSVILLNGVCVPHRDGTLRLKTNCWMLCLTCASVSLSSFTNGARYVSKDENACAPAHSFCSVPRKFTICATAVSKCFGGEDSTFPGTPLNPSSNNCRKLQPAQ